MYLASIENNVEFIFILNTLTKIKSIINVFYPIWLILFD